MNRKHYLRVQQMLQKRHLRFGCGFTIASEGKQLKRNRISAAVVRQLDMRVWQASKSGRFIKGKSAGSLSIHNRFYFQKYASSRQLNESESLMPIPHAPQVFGNGQMLHKQERMLRPVPIIQNSDKHSGIRIEFHRKEICLQRDLGYMTLFASPFAERKSLLIKFCRMAGGDTWSSDTQHTVSIAENDAPTNIF